MWCRGETSSKIQCGAVVKPRAKLEQEETSSKNKPRARTSSKTPLPADVLKRLDEIAALVPYRPFGEPFGIGWLLGNPAGYKGQGQG
jgi:hypothetical protein